MFEFGNGGEQKVAESCRHRDRRKSHVTTTTPVAGKPIVRNAIRSILCDRPHRDPSRTTGSELIRRPRFMIREPRRSIPPCRIMLLERTKLLQLELSPRIATGRPRRVLPRSDARRSRVPGDRFPPADPSTAPTAGPLRGHDNPVKTRSDFPRRHLRSPLVSTTQNRYDSGDALTDPAIGPASHISMS